MKYKLDSIQVTECSAVLAYCDVTGFQAWIKRASTARQDVVLFIQKMKFILRRFRVETGYFGIPIGDGMIVLVIDGKHTDKSAVFAMLMASLKLQERMDKLIEDTPYPRPGGFRVRVTAGVLFQVLEPGVHGATPQTDFIGDPMNLGARLLEVRREIPSIIHESAIGRLTPYQKRKLHLKQISILQADRPPRGVDQEDMNGLWSFSSGTHNKGKNVQLRDARPSTE